MERGKRIPLHDHSDRNSGGRLHGAAAVRAVGMSPDPTTPFGGTGVGVIPTHTYELANEGGDPLAFDMGNLGATETIDPTNGNAQQGTLDADCTITLAATSGDAGTLLLWLTQDGTGGRDITWSGSVSEIGTPDTSAGTTNLAVATTIDGGASWVVAWIGGSVVAALDDVGDVNAPSPSDGDVLTWDSTPGEWIAAAPATVPAALDDLTDVTISSPAEDDDLRYNGSAWVNDPRKWEPVTDNPGTGPELVFDGDDLVMEWSA